MNSRSLIEVKEILYLLLETEGKEDNDSISQKLGVQISQAFRNSQNEGNIFILQNQNVNKNIVHSIIDAIRILDKLIWDSLIEENKDVIFLKESNQLDKEFTIEETLKKVFECAFNEKIELKKLIKLIRSGYVKYVSGLGLSSYESADILNIQRTYLSKLKNSKQ